MSQKQIFFEHDFFKNAISGMIWYIRELMKPYSNTLSSDNKFYIGIMNTGDEKFMFDMVDEKAIYQHVPRWTFNILGINTVNGERTNPYENGTFTAKTKNAIGIEKTENFSAPLARRPVDIGVASSAVFSNIFEYFRFVEIYLTISIRPHVFKFYHANKLHYGSFTFEELADTDTNVTFGMEAEKRNRKLPINFTLRANFPAYHIYGIPGSNDEGFNSPNGPGSGGGTENLVASPMLKIIHNIIPKFDKTDDDQLIITQIITKDISEMPQDISPED